MSDQFQIESPDQKEKRKKILELASQECDNIQSELVSWRNNKIPNPGSFSTKSRHSEFFDDKIEEIQNKLREKKSFYPAKSSQFEQKVSNQSSVLTQELFTKQLQLFQEKHTIETKNLKDTISHQIEKMCRLEQENSSIREKFKNLISEAEEKHRATEAKIVEKDSELMILKEKLQDNETIIRLLEEKMVEAEKRNREMRDLEMELQSSKAMHEREKRRREVAENEYRALINEVKAMNERSCEEVKRECQEELSHYKEKAKRLEKKLKLIEEGGDFDKNEASQELSKSVKFYEEKCKDLQKQLKKWKVKTLGMAERMLALYKDTP